jgi:hypothetical protein
MFIGGLNWETTDRKSSPPNMIQAFVVAVWQYRDSLMLIVALLSSPI